MSYNIFIGWDAREAVASDVCAHSIQSRTRNNLDIKYLKHRELRKMGYFTRPWLTESDTGNWRDLIDNRPFSTEFSHTRFLVPALMHYKGWALFMDSDMIFTTDIKKLFDLCENRYAVMCVKHNHRIEHSNGVKMDGRQQLGYSRKNWSSFVLFNCDHPSNKALTPQYINMASGSDLHAFSWLREHEIGSLPMSYNFISGISPKLPAEQQLPDVIHYTLGGPWFEECQDVLYGDLWINEYEEFQRSRDLAISPVASTKYDLPDKTR